MAAMPILCASGADASASGTAVPSYETMPVCCHLVVFAAISFPSFTMNEVNPKRLVAILATFTTVIGVVMYPIYFYPKNHLKEYSKFSQYMCMGMLTWIE